MEQTVTLTPEQTTLLREKVLSSFRTFCQVFMDPNWFDESFHGPLCDFLQSLYPLPDPSSSLPDPNPNDGAIVLARSHLKTTICSQMYPLWRASNDSNIRILIVQNSDDNAMTTVRGIRKFIEASELYAALFPSLLPPSFTSRATKWTDSVCTLRRSGVFREGTFNAAGVRSNIISRHFDLIIEDDTIAPRKDEMSGKGGGSLVEMEIMPSLAEIAKAIGFHKLTIPLAVDQATFQRLFVGTRWAFFDVLQYIFDNESQAVDENGESIRHYKVFDCPAIGENGLANFKKFSPRILRTIKRQMGTFMYAALYLNAPLQSENMTFRPEWIRYFVDKDFEGNEDTVLPLAPDSIPTIVVDPADPPTGKNDQCYTGMVSALNVKEGLFVLSTLKGRFTGKEIAQKALAMADKDGAFRISIEKDRYPHLKEAFELEIAILNATREVPKIYWIEEIASKGVKKEARIMKLQPFAENGLLFLRRSQQELQKEMFSYPHGGFIGVDLLDSLAYHVRDFMLYPDYRKSPEEKKTLPNQIEWDALMQICRRTKPLDMFAFQRGS